MRAALVTLYVAAALVAATCAVLSWRRRQRAPLGSSLAVITAGAAEWSMAEAVAVAAGSPSAALTATYAMFPGVAMVVAGFLWHTAVFTGRPMTRRGLLLVHPVLLMTAVLTDPWHHLFFTAVTGHPDGGVTVQFGPLYWLHTAYCYTVIGAGFVRAVGAMRRAVRGHRRVFLLFLAGALAPLAGNGLSVFVGVTDRQVDLTPVLFLVSATVWLWAERFGTPARRTPVAYGQVIAALSDAVMVLDPDGRVLDVNPAAAGMLAELGHVPEGAVVGRMWFEVVGPQLTAAFGGGTGQQTLTSGDGTMYDVRVVRMRTADGSTPGAVVVVRDVTELERLRAELTDQAVRDGLTGVYNRRHLTTVLHERAGEGPLAVVMLDVDHFKAINDTYGHAIGDQVLIRLAQELTTAVGDTGIVARYGGEEFAIILPGMDAHAAADQAEQWRHCSAAAAIATVRGPLRATFSAGVAELVPGADVAGLTARVSVAGLVPGAGVGEPASGAGMAGLASGVGVGGLASGVGVAGLASGVGVGGLAGGVGVGGPTAGAGAAGLTCGAAVEDLLRRADRALYAAKEQGRNRVVTDTSLALYR
ncbi:histidine kinase N-terminal 7TM domain-containing diguanylate cyclase [Actinoplanes sp. CA-252034]|uniref:histidine kinase N-terminal 7TM domain-containing diguanylate cyclase n=1 Tax=Actinoplanes sp. CA-252034 TaxID=3239906 RepID=UPI003D99DEFD